MEFITDITVTNGDNSTVTIEGDIPFDELAKERSKAIAHLGTDIELDGFRKGHVPEEVLVGKLGEMTILTEMAERALARVYPQILKEHNIEAIGHPQVEITKIAQDNPLGFRATVAVVPDIALPDYKQIAKDINAEKATTDVTDEDVAQQIKEIMRQKEAYERLQQSAKNSAEAESSADKESDGTTDLPTPESEAKKQSDTAEEGPVEDADLPELTDEYVKGLGQPGQFETVDDFKKKVREHLEIEKEREVAAAHRAKVTDAIIDKTTMELPQVLIDSEINQMFAQMEEDLKRANLKMDDYLGHIKKTKEELREEWKPAAEKRAKLQLILNEIANKEEVTPDKAAVDTQVDQLMEQYKDADEAQVRVYVASVLTNEEVMKMLENQ